jgi:hypothetical protein
MSGALGYRLEDHEPNRVRTSGPSCEKLGRGIEGEYSLFQLHQPAVKA